MRERVLTSILGWSSHRSEESFEDCTSVWPAIGGESQNDGTEQQREQSIGSATHASIAQTPLFKREWTHDMTTNSGPPAAHALMTPIVYLLNRVTPHGRLVKYLEVQP